MNSTEFNNLLVNSENVDDISPEIFENIIHEFPYFQASRAIYLKSLKNSNNFKYNTALKKTAAHTIDRKVLFEYITSLNFDKKHTKEFEVLEDIEVIEPITVKVLQSKITNLFKPKQEKTELSEIEETEETEEEPIEFEKVNPVEKITKVDEIEIDKPEENNIVEEVDLAKTNIEETNHTTDIETNDATEVLELGKPLQFSSAEPHSFNEWMQLISQKPIERKETAPEIEEKEPETEENSSKIASKLSLIDKFIETNPKIKPVDKQAAIIDVSKESNYQNESLMTETLAKVYLEQKKYDNALKAYRILSLKYPEKSSFFANRIKAIKILQKNKS
ncbi:hypothetical protein [Lutibacter sp.]|uniref:hypothetical protein n=1 Tax=Lutibacter sp. TaxID=1925666 RepID=UPI00356133A1